MTERRADRRSTRVGTADSMGAERPRDGASPEGSERHPSLDERFDPAVRVVDYDGAWPALADTDLRRIKEALGAVAVRLEHVGSTAVPGLAAKPVIDLLVSVDAIQPRVRYVQPPERLGYLFAPTPESAGRHPSPSRRGGRAAITCMSSRRAASMSAVTSRFEISCAAIP
jgi:hypothetical protein